MKRFIALLMVLATLMSLAACTAADKTSTDTTAETEKPSNYDENGNLISIDQSNALVEVESHSSLDVYEVDSIAHKNTYRIPKLNVNLNGANTLSDKIYSDFKDEYGIHFSMLDDLSGEKVRLGEPCINIEYGYICAMDVVMVIIRASYDLAGDLENKYFVYYYDALTDEELSFDDFVTFCALAGDDLHAAAEKYLEENYPEHVKGYTISYITKTGDTAYDLYLTLDNGNMVVFPAKIESVKFDMSMFGG